MEGEEWNLLYICAHHQMSRSEGIQETRYRAGRMQNNVIWVRSLKRMIFPFQLIGRTRTLYQGVSSLTMFYANKPNGYVSDLEFEEAGSEGSDDDKLSFDIDIRSNGKGTYLVRIAFWSEAERQIRKVCLIRSSRHDSLFSILCTSREDIAGEESRGQKGSSSNSEDHIPSNKTTKKKRIKRGQKRRKRDFFFFFFWRKRREKYRLGYISEKGEYSDKIQSARAKVGGVKKRTWESNLKTSGKLKNLQNQWKRDQGES